MQGCVGGCGYRDMRNRCLRLGERCRVRRGYYTLDSDGRENEEEEAAGKYDDVDEFDDISLVQRDRREYTWRIDMEDIHTSTCKREAHVHKDVNAYT